MQQTKLKTNGTEYIINTTALRTGVRAYGAYGVRWTPGQVPSVTIVEKGLKTDPWLERANAVRVRVSDETWASIREGMGEERIATCEREFVVSSRKIIEGKAARVERLRAEEEAERERMEARNRELREKAGPITPEMIGRLVIQSEQQAGRKARDYRDSLSRLIANCQNEIALIDECVEQDYDGTLKEDRTSYPTPNARLSRYTAAVNDSHRQYTKAATDHNNWVTMRMRAEEEQENDGLARAA